MTDLSQADLILLTHVQTAEARNSTFRPWHGLVGRSKKLCRQGLLQETGMSVMWPYITYGSTAAGRAALQEAGR
jgi:hypothetical protein